ncbi:uncharacterized protein L201_002973 [Kwoniella dendrophila CBS 6074]|uniref:Elongin-A n=1 Tax=Kwoniella dendrophila CBS 6074 TaxID=1295534 RepID=A0AAX4JT41_9TREE
MSDPHMLEYEEEDDDIFGNESGHLNQSTPLLPSINRAEPITAPSNISSAAAIASSSNQPKASTSSASVRIYPTSQAGPSTGRVYKNVDDRLRELHDIRRLGKEDDKKSELGVRSLRKLCMGVVRMNSSRIWDIGDLEYPLIKPLIDDMPIEQLLEVEANSPHIKKDTDWLYEIFMLQDFPLFHERCQDRHGEPRTSGWRRMYKKAKEDFAVRQAQAADRVAARYKQLEEEKASKRIVVMDKIIPEKRSTSKSSTGWGKSRFGSSGTGGLSSSVPKPQNAIAKARLEAQRARVALTHASGKYIPPTPQRTKNEPNQLFKNPYLPTTTSSHSHIIQGPRIPPPKSKSNVFKQPMQRISSPSSPTSPIPGSYPTSQSNNVRKCLPSHLSDRASLQQNNPEKTQERFKIDQNNRKSQFKEIRKLTTPKFVAPDIQKEKPKGVVMDFFAAPNTSIQSKSGNFAQKDTIGGVKRKDREEDDGQSPSKLVKSSPSKPTSFYENHPVKVSNSVTANHPPTSLIGKSDSSINSVLFRKKKVVKGK